MDEQQRLDAAALAMRDAIVGVVRGLKTDEERVEAVVMALHIGYELVRNINGNGFMRGWIDAALEDLDNDPPRVALREPQ